MKGFLERISQEIMKKKYLEHQTLGRRFICPIGPATEREFILDWRISLLFLLYNQLEFNQPYAHHLELLE